MTDFASLLKAFSEAGVEFIVIGGTAATAHGSADVTVDLDVVYRRTPEAGRPKDLERVAELEAILEERSQSR